MKIEERENVRFHSQINLNLHKGNDMLVRNLSTMLNNEIE